MLFVFPFPLNQIPKSNVVLKYYDQFLEFITLNVGKYVLGIQETFKNAPNGSGDRLYNWANYGTILVLAIVITLIWTVLDRKRTSYRLWSKWFVLLVTYYLAAFMFSYGFAKVFYLQFRFPSFERLFQSYGHSSPMRLMWTFMGASKTYTVFAGMSEVIAGGLLIFRRTRVLGGLVAFGVMFNVFLMNMSYDIPVKLFSFQLMAMGLFIALIDYRRLLNLFVLDKNSLPPTIHQPIFRTRRNHLILIGVQFLLMGYVLYSNISWSVDAQKRYGEDRPKPALYGIYSVNKFVKNGQEQPPLATDTTRWNRLLINYVGRASIMMMDDSYQRYRVKTDTVKRQMTFSTRKDTVNKYTMKYELVGKDLKLKGVLKKDTLDITFKHYPLKNFSLINRGFHWINDVPYNRYKDGY
ncbi:hypothetical protein BKI52_28210 [marine bacterium AO1-C]|nr:hypothetical protein BKI52_28210 [marine bacterium AO1-C]